MRLQPLGPQGVVARMSELQAKLDARLGRKTSPASSENQMRVSSSQPETLPGVLQGQIGAPDASRPMSPFAPGVKVAQTLPGIDAEPRSGSTRAELQALIDRAAANAGIEPGILTALVEAESDFRPNLVSPKGAMGLTQLMPDTAKALGVSDPMDPEQNLMGGARYLAQLMRQFGNTGQALAAYNAGPGAVRRFGGIPPYPETMKYVSKILAKIQENG